MEVGSDIGMGNYKRASSAAIFTMSYIWYPHKQREFPFLDTSGKFEFNEAFHAYRLCGEPIHRMLGRFK
jgi:hypothetical protein